jgi:hypothetical protein
MRKMQYKTVKPATGLTVVIKNEDEFNKVVKPNNNLAMIIMLYTNWSEGTFFTLAGRYCYGTRVQIGKTEIKSYRWPRPYILNATKEELAEVKHQQSIANNKTSYAFTKEVAYLMTKAYRKNPLNITLEYGTSFTIKEKKIIEHTDTSGITYKSEKQISKTVYPDKPEYFINIADNRFPLTNDMQHFVEGVEKAVAELEYANKKATRATQQKVDILCRKYADGLNYNKNYITRLVTYEYTKDVPKINPKTGLQYTVKEKQTTYVETTEEAFVWKEGYRTSTNSRGDKYTVRNPQAYTSDIKTYPAQDKLAEAEYILNWLEQHDILDMHAYKCPKCGKVADTYSGCEYCGYDLPEEAKSDFNNGRITAEELASMSIEDIESTFTRNETAVSYDEWQCKDYENTQDFTDNISDIETDDENL